MYNTAQRGEIPLEKPNEERDQKNGNIHKISHRVQRAGTDCKSLEQLFFIFRGASGDPRCGSDYSLFMGLGNYLI